jgi:hypothetical protein
MPTGVIEKVFGAEMGLEIVNFDGNSEPEKRHETKTAPTQTLMLNRGALSAAGRAVLRTLEIVTAHDQSGC